MFVRNSFRLELWDQLGNVEESILWSKINLATSQLKPVLSNKLNPSIVTLIAPDHPIQIFKVMYILIPAFQDGLTSGC